MGLETPIIVPVSKPSKGSAGKTGLWRVERPVVDEDKCIKCWLCWLYCPEDVISEGENGFPQIDLTFCKGCGVCADVCPVDAIRMVKEEMRK